MDRRHHPGSALPPHAVSGRPSPVAAVVAARGALRCPHRVPAHRDRVRNAVVRGVERTTSRGEPALHQRDRSVRDPRRGHQHRAPGRARGFGRLARGPLPPLEGRRAPADQVGGPRADPVGVLVRAHRGAPPARRGLQLRRVDGVRDRVPRAPRLDRDRRVAVPPLRARRRRQEDAGRRRVRAARDRRLRCRRLALRRHRVRSREPRGAVRDRAASRPRVPSRGAVRASHRGQDRVREAGDPLRGPDRVHRTHGRVVRDGGRRHADGRDPRAGHRSRVGAGVAPRRLRGCDPQRHGRRTPSPRRSSR